MTRHRSDSILSRRDALAGLGAGGLALALAGSGLAAPQDRAIGLANHPIYGAWLVAPPSERAGFETAMFTADGSVLRGTAVTLEHGPRGVWFSSPGVGAWEPTGERSVAYTAVTLISDAAGAPLGSTTVDGYVVVSEDGQSLVGDAPDTKVTDRDTAGAITLSRFADPIVATRIRVQLPAFPGR